MERMPEEMARQIRPGQEPDPDLMRRIVELYRP